MFSQLVFLFFASLICIQINYTTADLIDDAKEKATNLGIRVNATSFSAEYSLEGEFLTLTIWCDEMDAKALGLIETQKVKIDGDVASIKSLGESAGVDISPCLQDRVEYLDSLPAYIDGILKTCITDRVIDANKTIERAEQLINLVYTRVTDIESQINLCKTETCVSPIIDFIAEQEVELPEKIELEVTRVEGLFDLLRVAIDECNQITVAEYSFSTTFTVNEIETCANELIG